MRLSRVIVSYAEAVIWMVALVSLYFLEPGAEHFSLCPLNALGASWCPGCGLGHSVHYYLHFDFGRGWQEHYLGLFAIVILFSRIFQLIFQRPDFKILNSDES